MTTSIHALKPNGTQGRWAGLRDELHQRRSNRAARRALEQELSTFTTPADVLDLLAAADQHDGAEVEEIRSILSANLSAHHRRTRLAA